MKLAYLTKKRYIKYDSMSTDDIEIMMKSINELINEMVI